MALEITDSFSEPYSNSTVALPSSFSPSVIGIAGVPYLMDTVSGQYSRQAFDVVQQRNTTDPRDVLLLPQDVWRQQVQSWHQGAGQSNADREDSLPYRYESSFGIDPWTKWQISLLPSTFILPGTGFWSGNTWLTISGDYMIAANKDTTYWYSGLTSSTYPVGSVAISPGNNITDIANDGYIFMCLTADKYIWYLDSPSGTPTKWANHVYTNPTFIAWEKDYLFAGDENKLYNALKSNSPTLIYTHPDTNFRWYSAASGNSCVYVMGRVGDRTTIHRVNIKSDGSGLNPCIVAAVLPDGEIGYTIDSYLGFILIGTSKGVRIAQPNNDAGDLTLGPIIPNNDPVLCFEGQDRFVWYGRGKTEPYYSPTDSTFPASACGLGRLDLSTTTTTSLTPAYANDIAAWEIDSKTVTSVVTFKGRRVFSIPGKGVWAESADDLVPAGYLEQGTMSFSVEDLKTSLYMQGKWKPLVGSIALDMSYDNTGYVRFAEFSEQGSIRSGNVDLDGTQYSRVSARYRLDRQTTTTGPEFTRWEIRAIPVKGRASRWTLPILNHEEVEIDSVTYTRDPLAVLDTIVNLVQNSTIFTLQEAGRSYQVHAKDFVWQPSTLTANGRAWQGLLTLVVEEVM